MCHELMIHVLALELSNKAFKAVILSLTNLLYIHQVSEHSSISKYPETDSIAKSIINLTKPNHTNLLETGEVMLQFGLDQELVKSWSLL